MIKTPFSLLLVSVVACGSKSSSGTAGTSPTASSAPAKSATSSSTMAAAPGSSATSSGAAASAEIKSAKGIKKHDADGVTSSFVAGEKAYVWARVKGANGTSIKMVWKKDGKEVWSATLPVKSADWRTHARRTMVAGKWIVDVLGQDGAQLGEVSFDATPAPAAAVTSAAAVKDLATAFGAAIQKKDKAALAKLVAADAILTMPDAAGGDDTEIKGADAVAAALLDKGAGAKTVVDCSTTCCTFKEDSVEACFSGGKANLLEIGVESGD